MKTLPSVLWCCRLGDRKGIQPVETEWWGAGVVICLERGADLHTAQLMPLPLTVSWFTKIQIGFTFLVPAHPGSPGQTAVKWVRVRVSAMTSQTALKLVYKDVLNQSYNPINTYKEFNTNSEINIRALQNSLARGFSHSEVFHSMFMFLPLQKNRM